MAETIISSQRISFDSELFVNREEEKELFLEKVKARFGSNYIEFNGVAGQGKSELLKWIYSQARKEGYLCAYIDFELSDYKHREIHKILKTITKHIDVQTSKQYFGIFNDLLSAYSKELRQYYHDYWMNSDDADRTPLQEMEIKLYEEFCNELDEILKTEKFVLCLDSTEKAYMPAFRGFEEKILKKYVENKKFMLVTAGQEKLEWRLNEVRKKLIRHDLPRLDEESTREQIKRLAKKRGVRVEEKQKIFDKFFDLTIGHPFSNYKLVDYWTDGFKKGLDEKIIKKRFDSSIEELIKKVIENRILENLKLKKDYPPAREILFYLSPIRHIEFGIFWFMLSKYLPDCFEGKPYFFFERLMDEFQNSHIFTPWQLVSGFKLEPVVRNILLWEMKENYFEQYFEIEKTLQKQYDIWVSQTHEASQIINIVERLFHYAIYLELEGKGEKEINTFISSELDRYLKSYFTPEFIGDEVKVREQLRRISNALNKDKDLGKIVNVINLTNKIQRYIVAKAEDRGGDL